MVADTDLAVGLMKVSIRCEEFDFAITFKPGARNHVEDTVRAVAIVGSISATLDLHDIHVFGVELRSNVGSDIGVGDRDAVDKPRNLVAAAHVELIVNHVCAGRVINDEVETVRAGGARRG